MNQSHRLPSLSVLPDGDAVLMAAACDIAILAGGLMAIGDSPLLTLAIPSDRWEAEGPLALWSQRLAPCADRRQRILAARECQPVLDALFFAADALAERLEQWGWAHVHATDLGLVTDGTGVALTLTRPRPDEAAAWLLTLPDSRSTVAPILPFAADGVWSLLLAEHANGCKVS